MTLDYTLGLAAPLYNTAGSLPQATTPVSEPSKCSVLEESRHARVLVLPARLERCMHRQPNPTNCSHPCGVDLSSFENRGKRYTDAKLLTTHESLKNLEKGCTILDYRLYRHHHRNIARVKGSKVLCVMGMDAPLNPDGVFVT